MNLLISLMAAIPAAPVLLLDLPEIVQLVAATVVYGAAYLALMRITGRLTDDDWGRLSATLSRFRPGRLVLPSR